jgi:4'-phosphopantetheinyl transferase
MNTHFLDRLRLETHVWYVRPESVQDPATLTRLKALLSSDEIERCHRFRFPDDRHRFLVSHALVRLALSRYAAIPPGEWRFLRSAHGRPEIGNPGIPALRFNLTHTRGLSACVVSLEQDCGIDAERLVERHNPLGVAKKMFSPVEYEELQQLKGEAALVYFFTHWTLREAYVKARGIGISFPTRELIFDCESDNQVRLTCDARIDARAHDWQFRVLRPTDEHVVTVALRQEGSAAKKITGQFLEL